MYDVKLTDKNSIVAKHPFNMYIVFVVPPCFSTKYKKKKIQSLKNVELST